MKRAWLVALVCSTGVAAAQKPAMRVAVLDFTPAAPSELDPLGAGLQSMITTDLSLAPNVVLVERARLKDVQAELHLQQSGAADKATAAKIGELAGASHLVVGSFTVAGGKMRLDARMFVVGSGEITLAEKMEGPQASFFELEKQLVDKIVAGMGVRPSRKQKQEMQKPETKDSEASKQYSQGLALFDAGKLDEATAAMQAAVGRDRSSALAQARLSEWQKLLPALHELAKKAKPPTPEVSCKPNSLVSPSCAQPGQTPPSPTMFNSDGRPFGVTVKAGTEEATCVTPCQLSLPQGNVELAVSGPASYHKTLTVPAGPVAVKITARNKINLIVGSVLAGVAVAGTAMGIAFFYAPVTSSGSGPSLYEYGPIVLSLATGAAGPAIYYLMHIGKNDATVTAVGHP